MKKKIGIGFVIYVTNDMHAFFTQRTICSIPSSKHHLNLVFYYNRLEKNINLKLPETRFVITQPTEVSVAAAWNKIIKLCLENDMDYVLIANTDIVFHPQCIDNLVSFAEAHDEFIMWTASEYPNFKKLDEAKLSDNFDEHPHFSCFLINQRTIEKIGYFDENYKRAYMEDIDYHVRILAAKERAAKTDAAKFFHFGSRTIECSPNLKLENNLTHHSNREYFKKKWGVDGWAKSAEEIVKDPNFSAKGF